RDAPLNALGWACPASLERETKRRERASERSARGMCDFGAYLSRPRRASFEGALTITFGAPLTALEAKWAPRWPAAGGARGFAPNIKGFSSSHSLKDSHQNDRLVPSWRLPHAGLTRNVLTMPSSRQHRLNPRI